MSHYVLYELASGNLVEVSEIPFTADRIIPGLISEFKSIKVPDQKKYWWNPDVTDWRRI